jgi:hypothetical protein
MEKCTTGFGYCICSVQHLSNAEIGKRISSALARRILVENLCEPNKLSEVLTMLRIIKQLKWSMGLATEVEYTTAIYHYQQITNKPTKLEASELKSWIECIGASIVRLNLEQDKSNIRGK